jgi:hypothetical protein
LEKLENSFFAPKECTSIALPIWQLLRIAQTYEDVILAVNYRK